MSYSPTIANPVSTPNLGADSTVSNLENALMQSIEQGLQGGQSSNSAGLQQEMQLLTDLLNQSNTDSNSSQTGASTPATGSTDPSTNSDPSTSTDPSTKADPTNNGRQHRTESKLERELERTITQGLQSGQTPSQGNALDQEMQLLIQLLGQNA